MAFTSRASNLVAGLEDLSRAFPDVFVHDRATGVTVLVSHAAGSPVRTGPHGSSEPALSADGSWIAYGSFDPDLAAGVRDAGTFPDLFLYERATGTNRAVTVHPPGLASTSLTTLADSHNPSVSGDGRYVAFSSYGPPLVPGIGTSARNGDIYLHDRVTRRTVLVSRSTGAAFAGGNADSQQPRISRDGSVVVFHSLATDLVPGQRDRPGTYDVFLWDRQTGRTTLVSRSHASRTRTGAGNSFLAGVSADGNGGAFQGSATDLVPRQRQASASNVFLWDRRTGAVTLVSHRFNQPSQTGNDASLFSSMSADGAFIAFDSIASDLVAPPRDANGLNDAFLFERRTGQVTLLSRAGGAFAGRSPLLSADGRRAAFVARNHQRPQESLVVLDRLTGGAAEAVPSTSLIRGLHGFSDDGRWLLFTSDAPDLVPGQAEDEPHDDLFLFDSVSREVRLVSHVPGDPARAAGRTGSASLSPDGRWAAFISYSPLLFPDEDGLQFPNLFLYDRTT
ncbi:MAG TPA: hypothetical protein VG477_19720, partial [Thermoanaerobaculia bacterium]|nr:hypothetical protein [Thermoanaerobaculia bacterium]